MLRWLWRGQRTFLKGVKAMPRFWQAWLFLLFVANAVVPLFFLDRYEALLVLGMMIANATLMTALAAATGFTRLLGLGHFPWFALLALLWPRLAVIPPDDLFGLWLRAVMALNAASLAIDVIDVVRYVRGERTSTVQG